MAKRLYVGNLGWGVTDDQLRTLFSAHGSVQLAQVMMDRDTGRSKGFGFVEMGTDQEAAAAITGMNGQVVEGRPLTVNERGRARTAAGAAAAAAAVAGAGMAAGVVVAAGAGGGINPVSITPNRRFRGGRRL